MLIRLSILSFWSLIDPLYYVFTRLEYLEAIHDKKAVFRVRLTRYKGKGVILSDGTKISKNDCLVKIHLHNVRLLREMLGIKHPVKRGRTIYKLVAESMPVLARFVQHHPDSANIKGVIGITMLDKGSKQLGFECISPDNRLYKWVKMMTQLPIYFLSTSSFSCSQLKNQKTVYLMMSKDQLLSRFYGANKQ